MLGLLAGCGAAVNPNAPATVSGKVTYKGTLLTAGNLAFHTGDSMYPASIGSDGAYLGRDFPIGEMTVTVETESLNPAAKAAQPYPGQSQAGKDKTDIMMRPRPAEVKAVEAGYVKIPAKYADKSKSGLTVKLTAGKQTKDFELTD